MRHRCDYPAGHAERLIPIESAELARLRKFREARLQQRPGTMQVIDEERAALRIGNGAIGRKQPILRHRVRYTCTGQHNEPPRISGIMVQHTCRKFLSRSAFPFDQQIDRRRGQRRQRLAHLFDSGRMPDDRGCLRPLPRHGLKLAVFHDQSPLVRRARYGPFKLVRVEGFGQEIPSP